MTPTILFHPAGLISAKALAAFMGISRTKHKLASKLKANVLIRWGSAAAVAAPPAIEINKRDSLRKWGTRHGQLALLQKGEVNVPPFGTNPPIDGAGPILTRDYPKGKQPSHGVGIKIYSADQITKIPTGHNLYMTFIDKARQFRVHIVGDHFRCRELLGGDKSQPVWNYGTGFTYMVTEDRPKGVVPQAKLAVKALGLDFGAVDIITDANEKPYVLEVNTAPGLCESTLSWYAQHLASLAGLTLPAQEIN